MRMSAGGRSTTTREVVGGGDRQAEDRLVEVAGAGEVGDGTKATTRAEASMPPKLPCSPTVRNPVSGAG